jgi:tetratricopeptide (TPR) repeat protein
MRLLFVLVIVMRSAVVLSQDVENLLDQGYEAYLASKYMTAVNYYSQAIDKDGSNPEAYFLRGISYHGLQEVEKAVNDLKKAIELEPEYVEAYQELGYIYLVGQAPKRAIEAFDKAIELDPTSGEVFVNRGTAKCMLDDTEGAEEDWKKAQELGVEYSEYMKCE